MNQATRENDEIVLVVQRATAPATASVTYLRLMFNYLYGLEVLTAEKPAQVASLVAEHGANLCAVVLIQDAAITNRNTLESIGRKGQTPVILLMPPELADQHQALSTGMTNVHVCDWTKAVGRGEGSLQSVAGGIFKAQGIVQFPVGGKDLTGDPLRARLLKRLNQINTLPTLPEFVLRISKMLRDKETTAQDLEKVLLSDVAVVHRLLKVMNSSTYAGTRGDGHWTLREAIVRLGLKQVGAIAQQVKLINSLVRPEDSQFDLRRFWAHSVGCACIADRLCRDRLIPLKTAVDFDVYWTGALLHDIGKLILGFLAWDYFAEVLQSAQSRQSSFQRAEERLSHEVTHEYLGRLMLIHSGVPEELAEVVGSHNSTDSQPSPLVCLVHIANNLCRDLGLGYAPDDRAHYNASVLVTLGLSKADLEQIRSTIEPGIVAEVQEFVKHCLSD